MMSHSKNQVLIDDLGLVFELGINIGILAGIRRLVANNKMGSSVHTLYDEELKSIKLTGVVARLRDKAIRNGVTDPNLLRKITSFIEYLVFLGVHKGFNFIVEYCQGLSETMKVFRREPLSLQTVDSLSRHSRTDDEPLLLYYQCDLQQLFQPNEYPRYDLLIPKLDKMFKQLDSQIKPDYQRYQHRGQFLKADIIMLFQLLDRYRVVVIDVGLFSVAAISQVPDLSDVRVIKQRLRSTYQYMRQKTVFEHLSIDSEKADIHYSPKLAEYFAAFSRDDKDTEKMIQAGGYAHSFVQCLKALLPKRFNDQNLEVNAIGLTDRAYNATFIADKTDMPILQLFQQIYQKSKQDQMPYLEKRALSVQSVFNTIYSNFKRTFRKSASYGATNLAEFVQQLQTVPVTDSGINQVAYTETLTDFYSTADDVPTSPETETLLTTDKPSQNSFRQVHARLITAAMCNDDELLFLTGHPGIGKTTAIVNYILTSGVLSEGVLFFYFSPRTQVNYDIIEKLSRIENGQRKLRDDRIVCIYSNNILIHHFGGQPVIKYVSNTPLPTELKMPTAVVEGRQSVLKCVADDEEVQFRRSHFSHSQSSSDNKMEYSRHQIQGVLKTVCSAICTLRQADSNLPRNIVATATVQSLKKTQRSTTAQHLNKIFAEAARDKQLKQFDGEKLAQIAHRNRHIIFMVDEVIGDSGGTQLLHELVTLSKRLKLARHFKLKIIASDASVAGKDVIKQHLSKPEPSPAKILYRQLIDKDIEVQPLSVQQTKLKMGLSSWKTTLINANTFPASELILSYKVSVETAAVDSERHRQPDTTVCQKLSELLSFKTNLGVHRPSHGMSLSETVTISHSLTPNQAWMLLDIIKWLCQPSEKGQMIVYIQNIKWLNQLIQTLQQNRTILPEGSFDEFQDYLQIHSSISDETRHKIHQYKNAVKLIFMTSSASRGVTFARVRHILIEVPKFQVENNLMEIIQTAYRGRGGETDEERRLEKQTRRITFYLHDVIHYNDSAQRLERYQQGITGLMNILLLVRAALKTRLRGYGDIGRKQNLRIIPVGGKHIDSVGDSLLTSAAHLLTEIKREIRRHDTTDQPTHYDHSLARLKNELKNIFVRTKTQVSHKILNKVDSYYEHFSQYAQRSFYDLLSYDFEPEYYIDGDLITMPIVDSEEQINILNDILEAAQSQRLVERMQGHAGDSKYSNHLRMALTKIAIEIENMQQARDDNSRSQDIYSQNSSSGQFISIPLQVLFKPAIFRQYFRKDSETLTYEAETIMGDSFRDVLGEYLYLLYQMVDKLPLDGGYRKFPFLLFRSDNLTIIRQQRYDRRYLFSSTAFNLINLVLSQTE